MEMEEHPALTREGVPLWAIGVIINILGSISINLSTNLIKLSHVDKERKQRNLQAAAAAAAEAAAAGDDAAGAAPDRPGGAIELSSSSSASGLSLGRRGSQSREPLNALATTSTAASTARSAVLHLDAAALEEHDRHGGTGMGSLRTRPQYLQEGHIIDGGHNQDDADVLSTCTSKLDEYQQWLGGLVGRGLRLFNLVGRRGRSFLDPGSTHAHPYSTNYHHRARATPGTTRA